MRSSIFRRAVLALSGLVLFAVLSTTAAAAEPKSYELADATHAGPLAITSGGTAWFVPSRGTEWEGHDYSIVGSLAPDGTISEREIAGFSTISDIAIGPEDALWVSGFRGRHLHKIFEIGRLSPTGELLRRYSLGHAHGRLRSLTASAGAVWLIRERWNHTRSFVSIEGISIASGKVRSLLLRPKCHAHALDVAPDGTPWFTEKCGGSLGEGASSKTSIGRIEPDGKIVRRRIAARDYPVTLAIGPHGTVWFGAWGYYQANRIGRLTRSGKLTEFRISNGSPWSIAADSEGRLWFRSSFHRGYARALNSIGIGGHVGIPVCADPTCELEPNNITRAPDGSLWYGLRRPNYNTGGGGSGLYISEQIANEAGFLGHLGF
jgi:sugar lactone lactonase YvrE